jgi:hypothetical protein
VGLNYKRTVGNEIEADWAWFKEWIRPNLKKEVYYKGGHR